MENNLRTVEYERVSTDEQAIEGYSLASQQEKIRKFIESQGNWDLVDTYIDDGYSAKDLNRPAMQKLIEDAKMGKFDVVVFYKLDRLVRSVSSLHTLLKTFEENGVMIKSVTEVFDTTSALGRFFLTLVAAMAEWERETISERVLLNMGKKAEVGERNGAKAPFGYKSINSKLEIYEEEALLVKEIFRLYNDGKGLRSIAKYLQQLNINKDIRTISRMLENPVYCGKVRWGHNSNRIETIIIKSEHIPAIIREETYDEVQNRRIANTKEGKKASSPYPFSGVLRCARCGSALSGQFKKERGTKHYICIGKKNKGTCDLPIFTEKALISEFLKGLSTDNLESFIDSIVPNLEESVSEQNNDLIIAEIEKQLNIIKKRKKNWMLALGDGIMTHKDYSEMMSQVLKEENLLIEQVNNLSSKKNVKDTSQIIEHAKNISVMWDRANENDKKNFINLLFEEIVVDVPRDYRRGRGNSPSVDIKEVKLR
ncbi:recombinase family protein [Viridibacillus arvi]|uniref:recombinase family protein n=1 Tax=Viridibacillus arvi TaxID=263475 RepID=UPI003D039CA0